MCIYCSFLYEQLLFSLFLYKIHSKLLWFEKVTCPSVKTIVTIVNFYIEARLKIVFLYNIIKLVWLLWQEYRFNGRKIAAIVTFRVPIFLVRSVKLLFSFIFCSFLFVFSLFLIISFYYYVFCIIFLYFLSMTILWNVLYMILFLCPDGVFIMSL